MTQNSPPVPARRIAPLTLVMALSMLTLAVLFALWPQPDLAVSAFFYRTDIHAFVGRHSTVALAIYKFIPLLSTCVIGAVVLAFIGSFFIRDRRGRAWRIRTGFLAAALALGPGLVVDVVLKDYWGRARPSEVVEFGGQARFTPAFLPSDQGGRSFVSGHASAGFFVAAFGFFGGSVARRRWTLIGLAFGGIVGFGRITQGGHFLSDVVFAFYFTWFSVWLVWVIFRKLGWLPIQDAK
ncbi:MAG: phosphatase PAP2 family protein [Azoarcus sp.]|nr:phosphatase PAP2 family protein [Azoarcus sp.]